ncbi:hypothetical protein EJ04DRAFT_81029 [Polyplosphaeria fusca]|uniref:Uncharacterized protein n=1 Tax=Polyplosphaeria fusca TaxID=682080 RepID=A0A9P4R6P5_9PLEO|nr:hypothetical protein EJ04DRAFT_81029 [Polyplosphaeria fusca]
MIVLGEEMLLWTVPEQLGISLSNIVLQNPPRCSHPNASITMTTDVPPDAPSSTLSTANFITKDMARLATRPYKTWSQTVVHYVSSCGNRKPGP